MQSSETEEGMKQQHRTKTMTDMISKNKATGRMDAINRWWVSELLAADWKKAWRPAEWEDTMQRW